MGGVIAYFAGWAIGCATLMLVWYFSDIKDHSPYRRGYRDALFDTLKKLLEKEETPKYKDYPVIRLLENGDRIAALRLAIAAFELATQKQPVHNPTPRYGMGYEYYDWVCPNCGTFLAYETQMTGPHHCKCGQAINWEGLKNDEGDL